MITFENGIDARCRWCTQSGQKVCTAMKTIEALAIGAIEKSINHSEDKQ